MTEPLDRAEARLDALVALERDTAPTFSAVGEHKYRFIIPAISTVLEADYLRREGAQLKAEVLARCELPGAQTFDGVLSIGDLNLSSPRTRKAHAQYLAERAQTGKEIDWIGLLEEFSQRILAAEREGEPAVLLSELPDPGEDRMVRVMVGLDIPRDHPLIVFGDGGTTKSMLGLWLLGKLSAEGLRVGMVDWESDQREHRRRLGKLFPAELPPIHYIRATRAFVYEAERVRRVVREAHLDYLLLDSIGFACDKPAETQEATANYAQAIRQVGEVGSCHIAHVRKHKPDEKDPDKPYGSVFWHNLARMTWFVKLAPSEPDNRIVRVGIYNKKYNHGCRRQTVGLELAFMPGETKIKRFDLAEVVDLAASMSVAERVISALRAGPKPRVWLKSELEDVKDTTFRGTLSRLKKEGKVLEFGDRYSLAERRESE